METMYRIEEIYDGRTMRETIIKFRVVKATKCGVWIQHQRWDFEPQRFVNLSTRKKYAHPTIEEARQAFRFRKERQVSILSAQLEQAKLALAMAHKLIELKGNESLDSSLCFDEFKFLLGS